jgi:hypothetical protein
VSSTAAGGSRLHPARGNRPARDLDDRSRRQAAREPDDLRRPAADGIRCSSNGKLIYLYEAGNTIDLYEAATLKYLRTVTLDADMMYGTFYVVGPRR